MTICSHVMVKTMTLREKPNKRPVSVKSSINLKESNANFGELLLHCETNTKEVTMCCKEFRFIILFIFFNGLFCTRTNALRIRNRRWDNNGDMNNMFRGTAGVDYPDLNTIPTTSFRCSQQVYEGGLYADIETGCQVYHVCHDGRKDSFLCGKGTIFNQQILACDYWYSTECDTAPNFYYLNSQIGGGNVPDASRYENQPHLTQNQPNIERTINSKDQTNYQQDARDSHSYDGNNDQFGAAYYDNQRQPNVDTGYGNQPNVDTLYGNQPNVDTTYGRQHNVDTTYGRQPNVDTTYGRQPNVDATYGGDGNMQPGNGNQNFNNPSDQSSCQGWGYNNNKTPWSFPSGIIMNSPDK